MAKCPKIRYNGSSKYVQTLRLNGVKEIFDYNKDGIRMYHKHRDSCYHEESIGAECNTTEGWCEECGKYYTDHDWSCDYCGFTHSSRESQCTCGKYPYIAGIEHDHYIKECICGYDD